MKSKIKTAISCCAFIFIVIFLFLTLNDVSLNKINNRYYALEQFLKEDNQTYDVQVYGSCHAYTSFNAKYFEDEYGISSYVFANPSEIIPVTYLRMLEQFKKDVPKVVLLDTWGMNAYDTYIPKTEIFEDYLPLNVEWIPYSKEKAEVINDFSVLDMTEENVAIFKYKDRFLEQGIDKLDFKYSFERFVEKSKEFIGDDMKVRQANNGYLMYTITRDVTDGFAAQPNLFDAEPMPCEADLVKYLDKIIKLCNDNGVKLILYRAPYTAAENEWKKSNWLANYCAENGVEYYNTSEEIEFDYTVDFVDQWHLNKVGAKKVTDFLKDAILKYIVD